MNPKKMKTRPAPPQVGQKWKENDLRFSRVVTVVAVGPAEYRYTTEGGRPALATVPAGKVLILPEARRDRAVHLTRADIKRFDGRSGGYSPVQDKVPNEGEDA